MSVANRAQEEIEETFTRIDADGDRIISFEEFASLMLEMDHGKTQSALRISFDAIDVDRDGRVSFDELRTWLAR